MVETFEIKRNDTKPYLAVTLNYANGSPLDLTGGSVFFNVATNNNSFTTVFSGACVITSAAAGQCEYQWSGTSTQRSGTYLGEFEARFSDGTKMTLPSDNSFLLKINEDYNAT